MEVAKVEAAALLQGEQVAARVDTGGQQQVAAGPGNTVAAMSHGRRQAPRRERRVRVLDLSRAVYVGMSSAATPIEAHAELASGWLFAGEAPGQVAAPAAACDLRDVWYDGGHLVRPEKRPSFHCRSLCVSPSKASSVSPCRGSLPGGQAELRAQSKLPMGSGPPQPQVRAEDLSRGVARLVLVLLGRLVRLVRLVLPPFTMSESSLLTPVRVP